MPVVIGGTLHALGARTGLRRTLVAYALYSLVEIAIWLALILYAFDVGGPGLAGVVAVAQLLPAVVLAPALASIGDRMPRGTALALSHAGVAVCTGIAAGALLVGAPVWVVVAAAAAATVALAVVRPIHFAVLPPLSRGPEDLVSANALSSAADGLALFAGPILAGVGVQLLGAGSVFALAAAAAGTAALLCTRLGVAAPGVAAVRVPDATEPGATESEAPESEAPESGAPEPGGWRAALQGLAALWRDWAALALLLVLTTRFVIGGALDILGVSFAVDVLGGDEAGAGLLIGAVGIGAVLGSAVAASVALRRSLAPVVVAGGVMQGVAVAVVAWMDLLTPAMVALAVAGVGGALLMVAGRTLLQRATDDRVMARVFAVQEGTSLIGVALGAAVAPPLVESLSPSAAFVPFGVGTVVLVVAGIALVRRLDRRAAYLPVETQLLRAVPFLGVLPPYELEQLARHASWRDVVAGESVIREGEPGDAFYVVATGEYAVDVGGVRRPTPLRSGDWFGEVALLESVPRTATVAALSAGRLLQLTAPEFLAAVTGHPDGRRIAADVASAHRARDLGDRT